MCKLKTDDRENVPLSKGLGTQRAVIFILVRSLHCLVYIWLCSTVDARGGMRQESALLGIAEHRNVAT